MAAILVDEKMLNYDEIKEKNYSLSTGQYFDIKTEYIWLSSPKNFSKKTPISETD